MWAERRSTIEDSELVWDEQGHGPTVIFLSGGPGDAGRYLRPLADPLTDRFHCLIPDLRGTGRSHVHVPAALTIDDLFGDVDRLRLEAGVQRVALIGHSFGATLALLYAAAHPDSVAGVAFIGLGPLDSGAGWSSPTCGPPGSRWLCRAAAFTPVQIVVGDWAARFLADNQPVKLAALEGLAETQRRAPLTIGGAGDTHRLLRPPGRLHRAERRHRLRPAPAATGERRTPRRRCAPARGEHCGLATAVVTGMLALGGISILHADAPDLFEGLTGRGLPLVLASAIAGAASVALVAMLASLGVGSLLFGPALIALLFFSARGRLGQEPARNGSHW